MTPFPPLRPGSIFLFLAGLLLLVPPAFAADYSSGVTAKVLKKTSVTGNGRKITYPQTDKAEVTAMTVELAPGAETGWHRHPVPVYAYVISGKLSVELGDGKYLSFNTGDAVIEVVNTLHNGKNVGTEPVKLVVFYLGVQGTPIVIKSGPPIKIEQKR
jgi:quercetin dioxygenase-like cupin family protein